MSQVIDMFQAKKELENKVEEKQEVVQIKAKQEFDFEAVIRKNTETKKRTEKERATNNQSVTKSYRLKPR